MAPLWLVPQQDSIQEHVFLRDGGHRRDLEAAIRQSGYVVEARIQRNFGGFPLSEKNKLGLNVIFMLDDNYFSKLFYTNPRTINKLLSHWPIKDRDIVLYHAPPKDGNRACMRTVSRSSKNLWVNLMAEKIFRTKEGKNVDLEHCMKSAGKIIRAEFTLLDGSRKISSKNTFILAMSVKRNKGAFPEYLGYLQFTNHKTMNDIFVQYQDIHEQRTLHIVPEVLNNQEIFLYHQDAGSSVYAFEFKE